MVLLELACLYLRSQMHAIFEKTCIKCLFIRYFIKQALRAVLRPYFNFPRYLRPWILPSVIAIAENDSRLGYLSGLHIEDFLFRLALYIMCEVFNIVDKKIFVAAHHLNSSAWVFMYVQKCGYNPIYSFKMHCYCATWTHALA